MVKRNESAIEHITDEYIDGAVKVHVKASEVPPRDDFHISLSEASKIGDETVSSNQEAYEKSHGKLYDMTHNNTVPWRNWAFYLIMLSLLTCCFTFAKYASFASGDAQAAVAKFDVVVTGSATSSPENVTVTPTSLSDPGNGTGNLSIVFEKASDPNVSETITFTVENNSEVTVQISSVAFNSALTHSYSLTGQKGGSGTSLSSANFSPIDPGDSTTFTLTVTKHTFSTSETGKTLIIQVDQVG